MEKIEQNLESVIALKGILKKLKINKLIVPMAYRLGYTTPTVYGWSKITDEQKALNYLLKISQIDTEDVSKDGRIMLEIVHTANQVVQNAVQKNNI